MAELEKKDLDSAKQRLHVEIGVYHRNLAGSGTE